MTVGIDKTLETIADLQKLVVDGLDLVKRGSIGLGSLTRLLGILGDLKELAADAVLVLPELADLDAVETGKIGTAAFTLVKTALSAIAA